MTRFPIHQGVLVLFTAFVVAMGASPRAEAQQHRATRLGDPAHRFATPLTKPEDLRRLLLDEALKADVESILRQASWKGDVEDLRKAAATADIAPIKLPKGTRMPFMSSRKKGKPVALIDVLWAGKQPIDAYTFDFASTGRKWRLITPKACANFFVVDLGPLPHPSLTLARQAPEQAGQCEPITVRLTVRNSGGAEATAVRLTDRLPEGLKTEDGQSSVALDVGTLPAGAVREFSYRVVAAGPGSYEGQARADSAERWGAEAASRTEVKGPVLGLTCQAPGPVLTGRPVEVCLEVKNTGGVPEPRAVVRLPVPAGAKFASATEGGVVDNDQVTWEVRDLESQATRRLCAVFERREVGSLPLRASVQGDCARQAVESACEAQIIGVQAILLEVVDLEDPVEVGKEVTYEIQVLNQGSATLTQIKITGGVPEQQEFVSGTGATAVRLEGKAITTEPLPSLAPKAEARWRVVLKATGAGDTRFRIELTGDQFPRAIEEIEATTQY